MISVAIPLALIASTLVGGSGPLGVNVPEELAALLALALVIGVSIAAIPTRPVPSPDRGDPGQLLSWEDVIGAPVGKDRRERNDI